MSPLSQGRELKPFCRGTACRNLRSPLSQGRELKHLRAITLHECNQVAPLAGA